MKKFLFVLLLVLSTQPAHAFFLYGYESQNATNIHQVDLTNGNLSFISNTGQSIVDFAFNPLNNYLYGYESNSTNLHLIDLNSRYKIRCVLEFGK